MITPGNLTIRPVEFNLLGRPGFYVTLQDETGAAYAISGSVDVKAYFLKNTDDALSAALVTRLASTAGIIVTGTTGQIFIDLTADVALFSDCWLYPLVVTLVDNASGAVLLVNTFRLFVNAQSQSFSAAGAQRNALYSIYYVNTLALTDYVGGAGYLDGIVTTVQPLHCWITFTRSGGQPEEWELVAWTSSAMNTVAGVFQQPLDFNASTNPKVWVRRS